MRFSKYQRIWSQLSLWNRATVGIDWSEVGEGWPDVYLSRGLIRPVSLMLLPPDGVSWRRDGCRDVDK